MAGLVYNAPIAVMHLLASTNEVIMVAEGPFFV